MVRMMSESFRGDPNFGLHTSPWLATVLAKRKERRRFYHTSFLSVDTSETGEG
jgi:hypothetical protein